ncbi:ABC transporter substrate-binding protein [Kiloniella sp. EL199]|uniref:ABC transporter substrate-binding protein n=1 Tax=Kiloniella sp. EL199 TaxID=2107581 RepID=UPI0013C3ECCF|nr:ABC transporter substrate-binding protein [Kiloniella sp. EL199]
MYEKIKKIKSGVQTIKSLSTARSLSQGFIPKSWCQSLCIIVAIIASQLIPYTVQAKAFDFPAVSGKENNVITIYSVTDVDIFQGTIADFQELFPDISIIYHDLQSLELYERIQEETLNNNITADIAISSAMDLQMKLANDGFAQRVEISTAQEMPPWSQWRNEVFGFTSEPAVTIYNKEYFKDRQLPKTRLEMQRFLAERPSDLFGRIATYDIERSGVGFLFMGVDSERYKGIWNLVKSFGANGVKLSTSSTAIINNVNSGKYVIGYNVLGSYALARLESSPNLGILYPEDYTTVLSRLAIIPKAAKSKESGKLFLEYLLSERGQQLLATSAKLNAVHPAIKSSGPEEILAAQTRSNLQPIKVGPGLLVYLDQVKRRKTINQWNKSLRGE